MSNAWLLLPDLLLILVGWAVCRHTPLNRSVWDAAERLVYYLLFPVLLFNSIVRSPLRLGETLNLGIAALAIVASGIVLAYALRLFPRVDARMHASGAQTAFRFNSFIALALAERLAGPQGVAWTALMVALCVPLNNVAAVWPLARHGGQSYLREIVRNPLILSTVAGLAGNAVGLQFPEAVATTLHRIGLAALPIGLMAVGAGLKLGGLREAPRLAAGLLAIKHALLPMMALALAALLSLHGDQRLLVIGFAALPTASSAYVLAARMGGHGPFVAGLVTLSTLIGMLSVPAWLAVAGLLAR